MDSYSDINTTGQGEHRSEYRGYHGHVGDDLTDSFDTSAIDVRSDDDSDLLSSDILGTDFPSTTEQLTSTDTSDSFFTVEITSTYTVTPSTMTASPISTSTSSTMTMPSESSVSEPLSGTSVETIIAAPTAEVSQAAASQDTPSTGRGSKGTGVAIGICVTLFILSVVLVVIYLVRKRHIRAQNSRRQTWNPPRMPSLEQQRHSTDPEAQIVKERDYFENIDINEKQSAAPLPNNFTISTAAVPANPYPYFAQPPPLSASSPPSIVVSTPMPKFDLPSLPPPISAVGLAPLRSPSPPPINTAPAVSAPAPLGLDTSTAGTPSNTLPPMIPITPFSAVSTRQLSWFPPNPSSISATSPSASTAVKQAIGVLMTVTRTFIPSLPDELNVQVGEQLRVVEKYDDGWTLCERMSGGRGFETGVVPLECLADPTAPETPILGTPSISDMGMMQERVEPWRLSHRNSSLNPAGRH